MGEPGHEGCAYPIPSALLDPNQSEGTDLAVNQEDKQVEAIVLRALQCEVERQCEHALAAFHLIEDAERHLDLQADDWNPLWFAIQSFVVAAGNISKLLWGQYKTQAKRSNQRRYRLRASLDIADNSVLKMSREMRGYWEHVDERIELWADESDEHELCLEHIRWAGEFGFAPADVFREYDPDKRRIFFRSESFEIAPVINAVEQLLDKVRSETVGLISP